MLARAACGQQEASEEPIRLRVTWGGGEATRWFGRLQIDEGKLADLKLLGMAADGPGSFWLESGVVHVASLSPRTADGVQVTASVGPQSKLRIELAAEASHPQAPLHVAVSDVLTRPSVLRLDERGNTLRVEAIRREVLRIAMDRDPPIFAPGEQLTFELQAALPDLVPGTTLDVQTTLSPARSQDILWTGPQRMPVPVEGSPHLSLNVPLPRTKGVYTVRVAAMRPSGFRDRFFPGATAPLAEESFDVVVVGEGEARARAIDITPGAGRRSDNSERDRWEVVLEVDPANSRWWERLPTWSQLRRIPGLNRGPLGSLRAATVEDSVGRFVELPPTMAAGGAHWQAYSLPLEAVGVPHVLELEYPGSEEQHLGISIVEPHAAGVVEGLGRDGGVYVEGFGRREAGGRLTHRQLFWPRSHAPLLLVTNQHSTAAARFGAIRVLKPKDGQLNPARTVPPLADRLVAAYSARPSLAEALGATKRQNTAEAAAMLPATVHDWQTFFDSATRLADYVHYGGYNSAVVNVLADGSSLYPSEMLLPTPRHNTARTTAGVREPDGLELLLEVFDREGLALLPAVQFAAPLPALEAMRRGSDPQFSGLEWVGPDGQSWLAVHGAKEGLAPYYNLLEPRVQQEILNVVSELVKRYGQHPSFAGIAVQLSAQGYAQLPPLEWGLDDATIERFERETGIRLAATGPQRFAVRQALVTGEHAEAWRSWRTACVTEFYQNMATLVRASGRQRRLLLTLEESFDHPRLAARLRPNLFAETSVDEILLDLGIRRKALEKITGIAVCKARYVGTRATLADRALELELNQAAARTGETSAASASVLFQRPQKRQLTSIQHQIPFQLEGAMTLALQPSAHLAAAGKPYVHALLEDDPEIILEGGEYLPLGQDQPLRHARCVLRQLPAHAEVLEVATQPVVIRSYSSQQTTTLVIANNSPWRAQAEFELQAPQGGNLEPLKSESGELLSTIAPRAVIAGSQALSVSLEPYAIEALRVAARGVTVADLRAQISEAGKEELAGALGELANRDLTAPRSYQGLANPGFEPVAGAGPVPGWHVSGQGATAVLDADAPNQGKTCLYLEAAEGTMAVESDPAPVPPTGQLAMVLYARGQQLGPRTELRVMVEADSAGTLFRRSFIVGGGATGQALKNEWQSYAVLAKDLPLNSESKMRLRFELSGPGEVWLDHLMLHELLFPLNWYSKSNGKAEVVQFIKQIHAARAAFETGQISDCVRLLEGYWPRFLLAYTPPAQQIAAEPVKSTPPASSPADKDQEAPPGISERLKRVMPFLR